MSDISSRSYSFSETAQLVGIDEKQLHFYAHKGLISPALSTDSTSRFSQVDVARLKVIDRAHQLGYQSDNIFNLIGSADVALKTADPVAACLKFAMKKYKEVKDELGSCEPLEQLNKQCDLQLITSYIKYLKEFSANPPQSHPTPEPQPPAKSRPVALSHDKAPDIPEQAPMPSPRIWNYSVAKLWDYMKKVDQLQNKETNGNRSPKAEQEEKSHAGAQAGQDSSDSAKQTSEPLIREKRPFALEKTATAAKTVKRMATEVPWTSWVIVALMISIAVTGSLFFFKTPDKTPQSDITAERSISQSGSEATVSEQAAAPETSVPATHTDADAQTQSEAIESGKLPSSEQPQETGMPGSSEFAGEQLPDESVPGTQVQEKPQPENVAVEQSAPAAVRLPNQAASGAPETLAPDAGQQALVKVQDLSLWHDSLNNIYRADLKIFKNDAADYQGPVSGYVFVYLSTSADASDSDGLLLPFVESYSGKPSQVKRGAKFAINHFKQMRITAISKLPPDTVLSEKIWVFSSEGKLLLEKPFNVPIQPFFSTAETSPSAPEGGATEPASTTPEHAVAGASPEPTPEPQPPAASQAPEPAEGTHQSASAPEGGATEPASTTLEHPAAAGASPELAPELQTPAVSQEPEPAEGTHQSASAPEAGVTELASVTPERPAVAGASPEPQTPAPSQTPGPAAQTPQPAAEAVAVSGTQASVQIQEDFRKTVEEVQPIVKPQKTDDPEAEVWEQKSYDAALQGDFNQTIDDATRAIELDPGRVNPYINRSWAYLEKGMLNEAVRDCRIALSIDPKNAYAYNNRGLARQRQAQFSSAREDYRKACDFGLDLGCQNFDALANQSRINELIDRSQSAFKAQDWDGVIRATTEVLNLDAQNAVALTNRSAAYAQKKFLNKALKDSNEALRYNPDFSLAYNNRGYVFELLGNNRKAADDYLKSCRLGLDLGCSNYARFNQRP